MIRTGTSSMTEAKLHHPESDVSHWGVARAASGELVAVAVRRMTEIGAAADQALRGPLPHVADDVEQAGGVGRVRVNRDRSGGSVREVTAEGVALRVRPLVAPRVAGGDAGAGGV